MADGTARLLLLGTPEQFGAAVPDGMAVIPISCQSEGAIEIYIEPVLPAPHLVIVGDSPMARTLASLAGTLGWRTDLIRGPDFTAGDADGRSMVVVATQGQYDELAVDKALGTKAAFIGLVASRKRAGAVMDWLRDVEYTDEMLARVKAPAGLDLGSLKHEEIAVGVLAELVQFNAARQPTVRAAAADCLRAGA